VQPVDFTTLTALCAELQTDWLPARLEQVYQCDRFTVALGLRTLERRGWLTLSWHPQAARLCLGDSPPRIPDTFTFSQQLRHQLGGLVLTHMGTIAPWERAVDLQFARRPGEPALWHLYVEIMGNYSNVILTNADQVIVTAAHQVNAQQSSVRPILTGQPYEPPPVLTDPVPSLTESRDRWQERVSLVPGPLKRTLLKTYRGLSSALVTSMVQAAGLDLDQRTDQLRQSDWQRLFQSWQEWLSALEKQQFQPGWTATGYTVLGWGLIQPVESVQTLVHTYYREHLQRQSFVQLRHRLQQRLNHLLTRLHAKADSFRDRLRQSDQADRSRQQADLLMAHLHQWQPGLRQLTVPDFATGELVKLSLDPEKNAVQNAQALYKRHQKLKRTRQAIEPLLVEVQTEVDYLEQVNMALAELTDYQKADDLQTLEEIRDELIQQGYLEDAEHRDRTSSKQPDAISQPYRFVTPTGLEILVGRNNRQNDQLTFRLAADYDLWFHTQEIPGSHVLLRLQPGMPADTTDLQYAADLAAYFSQGRHSEQVPVIYTKPRYVFKPKGARPGMTVYKNERVLWGKPATGSQLAQQGSPSSPRQQHE